MGERHFNILIFLTNTSEQLSIPSTVGIVPGCTDIKISGHCPFSQGLYVTDDYNQHKCFNSVGLEEESPFFLSWTNVGSFK